MIDPATPEQIAPRVNPDGRANQRINAAGKLLAAGVILSSLLVWHEASQHDPHTPQPNPIPELYCSDGGNAIEGQIDNWAHGGVEKIWDDSEKSPSMVMTYDLQKNENLAQVAACYFQNVDQGIEQIAKENDIKDPNIVSPGKLRITIENPLRVQLSDDVPSLEALAAETGFGMQQLSAANGMQPINNWQPRSGVDVQLPFQISAEVTDSPARPVVTTTTALTTTTSFENPRQTPEAPSDRNQEIQSFKEKWGTYAQAVQDKFGIDKNVVLAQAIIESNYGAGELALKANNLFGIKAHIGAPKTPYWDGRIRRKETPENLTDEQLKLPEFEGSVATGPKVKGKTPVTVKQPFRKYATYQASFLDYGLRIQTYSPYKKVYEQRKSPERYIELIAKIYATDPDYEGKVKDVYNILSKNEAKPTPIPPIQPKGGESKGGVIDGKDLNFDNFPTQTRDQKLRETIKAAASELNIAEFKAFRTYGVQNKSDFVKSIFSGKAGSYHQLFGRDLESFDNIVLHLWANGFGEADLDAVAGTESTAAVGNSHQVPLETQIRSWYNHLLEHPDNPSSAQFIVGDDGRVLQLTEKPFAKALHAGRGIMDEGRSSFPKVNNNNSIGIETQAGTIYDVTPLEFKQDMYLIVDLAIKGGKIKQGMSANEIRSVLDRLVVGHGKNDSKFNNSGVEFGWKYRNPLLDASAALAAKYFNAK